MKIGILSDSHIPGSSKKLPDTIYNAFEHVNMIFHAGDITNLNVLDSLRGLCSCVSAVCGNMDSIETHAVLPFKKIFHFEGYNVGLIHGWGAPSDIKDRILEEFDNAATDIIVYGHTHIAEDVMYESVRFINPGSVMPCGSNKSGTCGVLEINAVGFFDFQIISL